MISSAEITIFRKKIYGYYHKHRRNLPWRKTTSPYHILVSEIMLQQTQVDRVIQKYKEFIKAVPDFSSLAKASFRKVLTVWQGMGYNRRALYLKQIAEKVVREFGGKLPKIPDKLAKLPGIGRHTAGSICVFAYNMPVAFIETNVRSVFIHEFFKDKADVKDSEIQSFVEQTLDRKNPRQWYNALMDYGGMLKSKYENPSRKSAHYTKQTPFEGSNRQIRGNILKLLTKQSLTRYQIQNKIGEGLQVVNKNLGRLESEGFIREKREKFFIVGSVLNLKSKEITNGSLLASL